MMPKLSFTRHGAGRNRHGVVLPDSRVRKWFDVEGLDNLKRAQMQIAA